MVNVSSCGTGNSQRARCRSAHDLQAGATHGAGHRRTRETVLNSTPGYGDSVAQNLVATRCRQAHSPSESISQLGSGWMPAAWEC
jgi:hypothetical protein